MQMPLGFITGSNSANAIISVYKNEINGRHFEHLM